MRILLLIPILLLTSCMAVNQPLYNKQPEIVKVDARMKATKAQLRFLAMMKADLDPVAIRRHSDLISVFYVAFEVAFADGDAEKFQLNLNRVNAQIDALDRMMKSVTSVKPTGLTVPEVAL